MTTGQIRHMFPGGNTPQGFFSYYHHIIPTDANRIFIMKGGPGTGKSTFMRRIGEILVALGYDAEYHHCSSDNNSLDGLVLPALRVALIDGTAPHVVDPKNPGCVDEIIHLGDFWVEEGLTQHKSKIIAYNSEIRNSFQQAYRYLAAARSLYDDWKTINSGALDCAAANRKTENLIHAIFEDKRTVGAGQLRKLFASAITPDGPIHHLESSVWNAKTCYAVTGDPGSGKSSLLQTILQTALAKGLDAEAFYCPFAPEKPEHLVIPSLSMAVTTSFAPHVCQLENPAAVIDMNECLDKEKLLPYEGMIAFDRERYEELFTKSIQSIQRSKQLHDELETCYIPNMDFSQIDIIWQKTLDRVLAIACKASV